MIILLGFPKSGTTSFTHLFNKLGYKSYHWVYRSKKDYIGNWIKKNKSRKEKLLSFIPHHEGKEIAVTQMDVCIDKNNCYWPYWFQRFMVSSFFEHLWLSNIWFVKRYTFKSIAL